MKRSGDRKLNLEVEDRDQIMVDPDREKKSDKAGLSMRGLYQYIRSRSRAWKTVMMAMMVAIVFLTTYGLILPAITVEKKVAQDMPGVHLASDSSHDEERRTSGDREQDNVERASEEESSSESMNSDDDNDSEDPIGPEDGKGLEPEKKQDNGTNNNQTLTCQTPDGQVTLSYGKKALIPEGTCLELVVIRKGSTEYRSYEKILKREHKNLSADLYYRIRLTRDNQEIHPEKAVDISFTRKKDANRKEISRGILFRERNNSTKVRLIDPDEKTKNQGTGSETTIFKKIPLQKKKTIPVIGLISSDVEDAESTEDRESAEAVAESASTEAGEKDHTADEEITEEKSALWPAADLQAQTDHLDISVEAPEGALPEGTVIRVREIQTEEDLDAITETVENSGQDKTKEGRKKVKKIYAADITFTDQEGHEIEPELPVRVRMSSKLVKEAAEQKGDDIAAVHLSDDGIGSMMDISTKKDEVSFDADSFSVYALVEYTVDFHWEVDGETFEYSLAGGDSVSLRKLVEALHVLDGSGKSTDSTDSNNSNNEIDEFIADIEDVRFSDESLVKVAHVTEDTTAGQLKEALRVKSEYSAELTEDQRTDINAKEFEAPDWALISLKAFESEEYLTVDLKTGESFTIKVTDAQVSKDFLTASGETYKITVSYDDEAEIPDEADLNIREVIAGSVEEQKYVTDAAMQLGVDNSRISDARFFDIEIIDSEGKKIEPKTAVQVKIEYKDPVEISKQDTLSVVHFAEDGTEVITDLEVSEDGTEIIYEQGSFSVTGTIVNAGNNLPGGNQYMVLIEYPTGSNKFYIVNNDGSLTAVEYNNGTVDVEDPMLWTIEGGNNNGHAYFNSEATGFNYQDTAADYFRRYLDPSSSNGITEEDSNNITLGHWENDGVKTGYRVANRDTMLSNTTLNYYDNKIYHGAYNDGHCLGVELDEDGIPVHVTGNNDWDNAAKVVFAAANAVPNVGAMTHTVDHIDISISGKSNITVPLAYGSYYYKDGEEWKEYVVNEDTSIHLTNNNVNIEPEDMKHATIKAYDKNGNELNNAYTVTGYSSNAANSISTVQVRIEGRFKVADLNTTPSSQWEENNDYWKGQRINNPITYTVSATKPLTYDFIETDNGFGQLYEKTASGDYIPISITVDVNMSASFNYWDERNECPAIDNSIMGWFVGDVHSIWENGGIPHSSANGQPRTYLSGMDFKLGGDADDSTNHMAALEITKMVLDENHHMIKLDKPYEQSFKVYGSSNNKHGNGGVDDYRNVVGKNLKNHTEDYNYGDKYTELHSKDVTVGSSGMGLAFDYDVEPGGMYYIEEDTSDVPKIITDEDDNEWTYAYTYIETEYVWRNDGYSGRHESGKYTGLTNGTYISMPEVTGSYTGSHDTPPNGTYVSANDQNSPNWRWFNEKTGLWEEGVYWNGFLEYYVYNVYTQGTKLDVEKEWKTPDVPDDAEVTVELYYATKMVEDKDGTPVSNENFPESYEDYQPAKNAKIGDKSIFDGVTTEITLKADEDWKNTFENLPITVKDAEGNIFEVDYYAKEKSVKIPGEGSQAVDEHAQDITGRFEVSVVKENPADTSEISDGKVTISNNKKTVQVTLNKEWEPKPDSGSITVELRRYAVKSDGTYSLLVKDQYGNGVPGASIELYKGEEKIGTYTTDENGNLSVSGLKTGTYRYVQTAAPAGYKMMTGSTEVNSLEAESFTVDDDKTQEQSKRVELVNQVLKTTGTVTLTVVDNNGQPVRGGAWFDLYKGNEIVEGKNGLVTGNDGKIIVKGLEAGTYKFVQIATPSDYKMPSNTETTGFTVADIPGQEQSFTQSMTNTLRGKGIVTITLKDSSDSPIGGVKFTLLKDGAEVDSGYTDADGSLVFGNTEKLDEGTYVIHQATAIDGYDLAENQNFTVLEGDAGQTFEKNFVNQQATGNVNLVLMRKYGVDDGNQWSKIGNTITGLKAGTTYTIRATTDNKDMIPYHLWYFEAEGTYSNGTTPSSANINQNWSSSDWTIDGNTATKTFSFTPSKNNTTYTIALITDWSVNDLSIEVVRDRSVNSLQSLSKVGMKMRAFGAGFAVPKSVGDTPVNPLFIDAEPAEAPDGYVTDSAFHIEETITGPDWTYTFPAQDKYDANGNEYKYYVVETGNTLDNYYIESYSGDPLSESGTITITNAIKPGALTITKEVTVNGKAVPESYKTIADGTYTFTITGPDNYSQERTITVANGVAESSIVLTGLEGGNYTITETDSTNNNGISLDQPKTINVVPGTEASANVAAFVNNLLTTKLVLEKVDIGDLGKANAATLKGAAFRIEKYTNENYQEKDSSWIEQNKEDSDNTGVFSFDNLTKGYYKIVETKWPDGYIKVEDDPRVLVEYNEGVYSIKLLNENGSVIQEGDETVIKVKPSTTDPTVQFGNTPGAALPHTGGSGINLHYLFGIILTLGAGVMLWRRRRTI